MLKRIVRRSWTLYLIQDGKASAPSVICHLDAPTEFQLAAVDWLIGVANAAFERDPKLGDM